MSLSATAENKETQSVQTLSSLQDGARLIANDKGYIVFATADFLSLCAYDKELNGHHISLLFGEKNPNDLVSENKELTFITIAPTGKKLALQFDWIEIKKGERYLIASAEEMSARDKLQEYVSRKVNEQLKLAENVTKKINPYPFMDMSHDACLVSDNDGEFIYANQAFSALLGYDENDIQSLSFLGLIYDEDRPFVHRALQDFREEIGHNDTASFDFDARTVAKNGSTYWMEWHFKADQGHVFSLGRDITAIKKQKERLERQQNELSEAEAIAHMGHWRWRVGNESLRLSQEIYRIFGFESKDEFEPTLDNITSMIVREDAGRMTQVFQRAMIEQNEYEIDFRITRNDGETRYVRCEGRCEIDEEYDVVALYGIMQDVTDRVLREKDLRRAKESAERAYNAKSQFLANMSHELRTPLNAIIGFSEMMQHQLLGPIGNERYIEYVAGIRESGEHLLDLISDILDMSKIEAGKYDLSLEKFNIIKTMKMALHMVESRAADQKVKMVSDFNNDTLEIVADRRAIMQMVLNLLSNAVKFTKESGTITLSCLQEKDFLIIKVQDTGIGIPANKLANITMPFEQVECSYTREYEGSGLGLAITKELAEAHNGSLEIQSELDVGTTVTIRVPYKKT